MAKTCRSLLLLALICALSACGGWQLRGTPGAKGSAVGYRVYVRADDADQVGQALRTALRNRGALLVSERSLADLVIEVAGEDYDRRILSVDPDTGKVREIELGLSTDFTVRDNLGKLLLPRETIEWEIDYIFDEGSVLGTNEQDSIVQRDLAEIAATTMVLKLASIDLAAAESATP